MVVLQQLSKAFQTYCLAFLQHFTVTVPPLPYYRPNKAEMLIKIHISLDSPKEIKSIFMHIFFRCGAVSLCKV